MTRGDGSGRKSVVKRWLTTEFSTRCVENSLMATHQATTEKSSVVREGQGELS